MRRLLILTLAAACGGTPKPAAPSAPLPDDNKQATPAPPPPSPEAGRPAPGGQVNIGSSHAPVGHRPPEPTGPVDLKIPPVQTTVKLVSGGKGKKQPLRYTTTQGAKQPVELALNFVGKQDTEQQVVPTIVLSGEAESKTVNKDGSAEYALTVTDTDAREAPGALIPVQEFKKVLVPLKGLTIGGTRSANGESGEVTIHHDNAPKHIADALQLVRITFPKLPVLPNQPLGVGAKWQATTTSKFAEKLDVTQVTDYEVVAHEGKTWTIKGTTKISGKDQDIENAKISDISGSGTSETTITEGTLYPTHKASTETQFKATDKDRSTQFVLTLSSAVTPK